MSRSHIKMRTRREITLLWLCAFLWMHEASTVCPYTECDCSGITIGCEDKGLEGIPDLHSGSSSFTNLILAINSISTVPAGSLPSNLESLSFNSNPITTIDNTAFAGSATTLKTLVFSKALFTRIPDALLQLRSLTTLIISETNIQDWNDDVMKHLGLTVTTLTVDNTNLTTWPSWLQYFPHLLELSIDANGISDVPDGALDLVASTLLSFSQDDNKLKTIPKAVSTLTSLQTLSLTENSIADTFNLPVESQLMTLTLSNNNIADDQQLSLALQPYSESLMDFGLDNNKLTKVPDLYFLEEIEHLDLSHNLISDPSSGSVPPGLYDVDISFNILPFVPTCLSTLHSAVELNLPWNSIRDIHGSDFSSSVTSVDLTHNLITKLTASSFPAVSSIATLRLSDNPITAISIDAFAGLHDLTELYLDSARLTRIPLALLSLKSLKVLDLTDNRPLVCTCLEKSLRPWTQTFDEGSLRGSCGLLSVYQFFTILSPGCSKDDDAVVG